MTFTQYIGGQGASVVGDRISIGKSTLSFTRDFQESNPTFKNCERVSLYFDKESGQIGIKPAQPGDYGSLKISQSDFSTSRFINITGFIKQSGVSKGHYEYRVADDGMIVVDGAITQ